MKIYRVTWTERAAASLREIHDFIKPDSANGAKRVLKALIKSGSSLKTLPNRNPIEPLLMAEPVVYRFLVKWNYKLIYVVEDEAVLIVEVFDTRKDPVKLKRAV